jgi:cytochrome P450
MGGETIHRGETVCASLQAADHDPAVFDCSREIDVCRNPNPHIGCGAPLLHWRSLATQKLQLSLGAILRDTSFFDVDLAAVQRRNSFVIHGPVALPIEMSWV